MIGYSILSNTASGVGNFGIGIRIIDGIAGQEQVLYRFLESLVQYITSCKIVQS